jgi:hypothetical protein
MIKVETPKDNVLTIEPGFSEQSAIKGKELREHLIVNREFDGSQIDKAYTIKASIDQWRGESVVELCNLDLLRTVHLVKSANLVQLK